MTKHDDLIMKIYKHPFWNKGINETYTHHLEHPVIKGEGIYKVIIGYIDYFIDGPGNYEDCVNIEVKTTKESLGELLRQINKYREYPEYCWDGEHYSCKRSHLFYLIGDCMLEYKDILKDHNIIMIKEENFE